MVRGSLGGREAHERSKMHAFPSMTLTTSVCTSLRLLPRLPVKCPFLHDMINGLVLRQIGQVWVHAPVTEEVL